jgi:hypothetical protein
VLLITRSRSPQTRRCPFELTRSLTNKHGKGGLAKFRAEKTDGRIRLSLYFTCDHHTPQSIPSQHHPPPILYARYHYLECSPDSCCQVNAELFRSTLQLHSLPPRRPIFSRSLPLSLDCTFQHNMSSIHSLMTTQTASSSSSATSAATVSATAPHTQGHKRSKTAILKSIVAPHRAHRKSQSTVQDNHAPISHSLDDYMVECSTPPTLAQQLDNPALLPPLDLEPPMAPFATEDRRKRLHKKSLSSISLSSMISKKDEPSPSAPGSPRGSFDISGALRDLMLPNRNNAERAPSPQKPDHQKKPSKSKSAIDISILRKKATSEDKKEKGAKDQKENRYREPLVPLSPRSIHGLFTRSQNHPVDLPAEDLFAPPKIYARSPRPGLTPQGSDSSISMVGQPARKSTSSEDRTSGSRRAETEELMKRYTPTDYTPANQRNFNYEPALLKPVGRDDMSIPMSREASGDGSKTREKKPRPKSEFFSSTSNRGAFSILSPRKSYEMRRPEANPPADTPKEAKTSPTHSFSSKESSKVSAGLDLAGIDTAFEELLVCT